MIPTDRNLDLAGWIARIRNCEMPVFGRTIDALRAIMADDSASASALAKVILMDAPMTTKVLRLANSAYFNHSHQGVSTVSRAIVVLGFNPVVELALSVSLIDSLLAQGVRNRVHLEMGRSFHAAVQARWLARKRGEGGGEEVFIAALLARVGEMAFWCFGAEKARQLDLSLTDPRAKEEEVQQRVLGFPLRQLSHGLVREWKLGSLAAAALEMDPRSRGPGRSVLLGHRLAQAAEQGWDSVAGRQCLNEVAEFVGEPLAAVRADIIANAIEAAQVARTFGAPEAGKAIPQAALLPEVQAVTEPVGPDPRVQLRILQEIGELALTGGAVAEVMQLVLEGVFRGAGCDRVVIALLSEDRARLVGRLALGCGADALAARFVFPMECEPEDVLDAAIDSGTVAWLKGATVSQDANRRLLGVSGCGEACLVPFGRAGAHIGVLYADRLGKTMDDDAWRAVRLFALQLCLAMEMEWARSSA